jgi:hypothetical protein
MADLTALQAEVARNTDVDSSAITLLNGLAAQIEQLKTDPAALQALADSLRQSSDALSAAIVANTPAPQPDVSPAAQAKREALRREGQGQTGRPQGGQDRR